MDALLDVEEAAAALGTSTRFIRRLIAERRIRFHKIGKHVRIASTDLAAFVAAGRVEPYSEDARSDPVAVALGRVSPRSARLQAPPPRAAAEDAQRRRKQA